MKTATLVLVPLLLYACAAPPPPRDTARLCDAQGCEEVPRASARFAPGEAEDAAARQRREALEALARQDPRAAYDLALRLYRGDGLRRDSYQALQWMRDAAARGDLGAQKAVGRLYLTGLEEMGPDPQEAEKWLSLAAGRGDGEAERLLAEAREARRSELEQRRWEEKWRRIFEEQWHRAYRYRAQWRDNRWQFD